ncbi:hypothetical protein MJG53_000946 [Ovis ammon polii x Ovis aries]|uniref:Uncharacterized protein n=1 Tax=Ovis ammon polii x Ovis aries TaxID=2918886 RepID=A0ACB9VJL7_9CETA|nr:hypothetical protein MJT46_000441 [Ovis ammon polii x Ovis aries]KAI4589897.1 hypothetical protein MJG53_000946 [Ovis ammon polii x Ovis aries]
MSEGNADHPGKRFGASPVPVRNWNDLPKDMWLQDNFGVTVLVALYNNSHITLSRNCERTCILFSVRHLTGIGQESNAGSAPNMLCKLGQSLPFSGPQFPLLENKRFRQAISEDLLRTESFRDELMQVNSQTGDHKKDEEADMVGGKDARTRRGTVKSPGECDKNSINLIDFLIHPYFCLLGAFKKAELGIISILISDLNLLKSALTMAPTDDGKMTNLCLMPELSHSSKSADFYGPLEALPGTISEDGNIVPCWQDHIIKMKRQGGEFEEDRIWVDSNLLGSSMALPSGPSVSFMSVLCS